METAEFERYLGIEFRNKHLLIQALTHRSYINENRNWPVPHNERLELLGDAVLQLVVTEYLLNVFPKEPEGRITELRSALVCTTMLSQVAEDMHLSRFLFLSRGQKKDNERAQQRICADAVEAILGAVYLDQGIVEVKKFISRLFLRELMDIIKAGVKGAKSLFQEFAQKHHKITPHYQTIEASGPDHAKFYKVAAFLGPDILNFGTGSSKVEAETAAARLGYTVLRFKLREALEVSG